MIKKLCLLILFLILTLVLNGCVEEPANITISFYGLDDVPLKYELGSVLPDLSKIIIATADTGDEVSLSFDTSSVNMNETGRYDIAVTAVCYSKTETKIITIEVINPEDATFTNVHDFTITQGDPLPDVLADIRANDPTEGDISDRIEVIGLDYVDNDTTGKYSIIYSVCGYNGRTVTVVASITVKQYSSDGLVTETGKVLKINTTSKTLLVEGTGELNYDNNTKVYQIIDEQIFELAMSDVFIGLDNAYFFMDPSKRNLIDDIVIDGSISYDRIRVRINVTTSITGENNKYHGTITMQSPSSVLISDVTQSNSYLAPAYSSINVTLNAATKMMNVKVNGTSVLTSDKLITFTPTDHVSETTVTSILRSDDRMPTYPGRLEVSPIGNLLLLVNDVNIEDYLKYVVPSEMPTSFGLEALKVQAVAARTFALNDLKSTKYIADGYHVDDSVSTQVYNNSAAATLSNQAIAETAGIVATYNGNLISANFYSTSSGATSNSKEVWFEGTNAVANTDYLQSTIYAKTFGGTDITFDIHDESSMLAFYKMIEFDSYDGSSRYHRWSVSFNLIELKTRLQTTLVERFNAKPDQVLTSSFGSLVSSAIPSDIGDIVNIQVRQRGGGGLIIALEIVTTKYTFVVYGEYNIRMLFKNMSMYTYDASGSMRTYSASFLLSAFFAVEKDGNIITFYGGGYGHGAGMSQYGARGMAERGYEYEDILRHYYTDIDLEDVNSWSSPNHIGDPMKIHEKIEAYSNN